MTKPIKPYREWIREEFAKRCARNEAYSLRAFARDLDIYPSHLSDVLKGRIGISSRKAMQVAERLSLSAQDQKLFVALVEAEHARSDSQRELAKERIAELSEGSHYYSLSQKLFEIISDWQHFGILNLIQTDNFTPDPRAIAKRLGILYDDVQSAISRLVAVGLLKIDGKSWKVSADFPIVGSQIPSEAVRRYHRQILRKANTALLQQSLEQRDFSAMCFPVRSQDIPQIKEEIKEFRRKLVDRYKSRPEKDQVYTLATQLFSIANSAPETQSIDEVANV